MSQKNIALLLVLIPVQMACMQKFQPNNRKVLSQFIDQLDVRNIKHRELRNKLMTFELECEYKANIQALKYEALLTKPSLH